MPAQKTCKHDIYFAGYSQLVGQDMGECVKCGKHFSKKWPTTSRPAKPAYKLGLVEAKKRFKQ